MKLNQMLKVGSLTMLALCLGCGAGGPDIARVEGTVTMDGKLLPGAFVVFIPSGGRPAAGETDASGKYKLEFSGGRMGAIPGKSRVEISTARPPEYDEAGKMIPGVKEMVPAKYNRMTTLEFEVENGKTNIADFKLESKGKVMAEAGAY
jgi:hypothetical protein